MNIAHPLHPQIRAQLAQDQAKAVVRHHTLHLATASIQYRRNAKTVWFPLEKALGVFGGKISKDDLLRYINREMPEEERAVFIQRAKAANVNLPDLAALSITLNPAMDTIVWDETSLEEVSAPVPELAEASL